MLIVAIIVFIVQSYFNKKQLELTRITCSEVYKMGESLKRDLLRLISNSFALIFKYNYITESVRLDIDSELKSVKEEIENVKKFIFSESYPILISSITDENNRKLLTDRFQEILDCIDNMYKPLNSFDTKIAKFYCFVRNLTKNIAIIINNRDQIDFANIKLLKINNNSNMSFSKLAEDIFLNEGKIKMYLFGIKEQDYTTANAFIRFLVEESHVADINVKLLYDRINDNYEEVDKDLSQGANLITFFHDIRNKYNDVYNEFGRTQP